MGKTIIALKLMQTTPKYTLSYCKMSTEVCIFNFGLRSSFPNPVLPIGGLGLYGPLRRLSEVEGSVWNEIKFRRLSARGCVYSYQNQNQGNRKPNKGKFEHINSPAGFFGSACPKFKATHGQ